MAPKSYTVEDLITGALIEVNMLAAGDVLDGETGQWALDKANDLADTWQALGAYVYGYAFTEYTLVPALSPHTIGPDGTPAPTFSTGEQPRPVKLESVALLLNESPGEVDLIMTPRDHMWWAYQQTKQIETNVPTDFYYDPTSPLGSIYFWPVPNVSRVVRVQTWQSVSQFDSITDPIGGPSGPGVWPPGYRNAFKLTLAEMLCPGGAKEKNPELGPQALKARAAIFGNNSKSPRQASQDSGMPRTGQRTGTRGDFNWFTGGYPGGPPE